MHGRVLPTSGRCQSSTWAVARNWIHELTLVAMCLLAISSRPTGKRPTVWDVPEK